MVSICPRILSIKVIKYNLSAYFDVLMLIFIHIYRIMLVFICVYLSCSHECVFFIEQGQTNRDGLLDGIKNPIDECATLDESMKQFWLY